MASEVDATFPTDTPGSATAYDSLQTLLLSLDGVDEFLQEVAEVAGSITSPPASCGITVQYDGYPLTVASSDARARALDESQYGAHEGTCLHAMHSGEIVDVGDLDRETRWPSYFADARRLGLRSSLSLPLIVSGESIGAMNLYDFERPDAFDADMRAKAQAFAVQASTALLLFLRQAKSDETNQQLETALTSRSVIDQALGILMAQQRCTPEEAFALLRAHSQNNNRKLREIAEDLVTQISRTRPPNPD